MFSSHRHLERKTPARGINRQEFIGHLVDEYYTTTNIEAQEQVTANLANFAYDPINWPYLLEASALDLFHEILLTPNESLQLHGIAALCNICLDAQASQTITQPHRISAIVELFKRTENAEIVLHSVTLFYQLLADKSHSSLAYRELLVSPTVLSRIQHWRQASQDKRIAQLCELFLEDHGRRSEIIEVTNAAPMPRAN